jgi:hypothetical protein
LARVAALFTTLPLPPGVVSALPAHTQKEQQQHTQRRKSMSLTVLPLPAGVEHLYWEATQHNGMKSQGQSCQIVLVDSTRCATAAPSLFIKTLAVAVASASR